MFKSKRKGRVEIELNFKHWGLPLGIETHLAYLRINFLCLEITYWFSRSEVHYSDWHIWDQKLWHKLLNGLNKFQTELAKIWKIDKKAIQYPSMGGHYSYDPRDDKVLFFFDIGFCIDSKDFHVPKKVLQEIEEYKKREKEDIQ